MIKNEKLKLPQNKLNLLLRNSKAVLEISEKLQILDPTQESLTESLQSIKDKGSRHGLLLVFENAKKFNFVPKFSKFP